MWMVAKLTENKSKAILEGPICNGTQVVGWHIIESQEKFWRFHAAMSGFAFNSTILWDPKRWHRPTLEPIRQIDTVKAGFQVGLSWFFWVFLVIYSITPCCNVNCHCCHFNEAAKWSFPKKLVFGYKTGPSIQWSVGPATQNVTRLSFTSTNSIREEIIYVIFKFTLRQLTFLSQLYPSHCLRCLDL